MSDFTIKQGDVYPSLVGYLQIGGSVLPDLASATGISLILAKRSNPSVWTLSAAGTVVDAPTGKVEYLWVAGDTDIPGDYIGMWQVTYPGGGTRKIPTVGYFSVTIEPVPQPPPP